MAQFPFIGFCAELFVAHGDLRVAFPEFFNDGKELFRGWLSIVDGYAEAGNQGKLLLHGIGTVHAVIGLHVISVIPGLLDQVTAVGGGIDQHVVRAGLHTAFDDCFEEFVLNLEFLKRKVVHVDDKAIVPVFDLTDDIGQILKLMLVDLDHAQTLIVIFVEQGFDAGGFTGTGVTAQQHVVGRQPFDKCFGIIYQFLLLDFITDQIIKHHTLGVIDGDKFYVIVQMTDTESPVQTEHTNAICLIKISDDAENVFFVGSVLNLLTDSLHFFTYIPVVHMLFFLDRFVVAYSSEAIDTKSLFNRSEIKIKQLLKYGKICFCKMVDSSIVGTDFFTGHAERVFVGQKDKGQIVVPQVLVKSIFGGQV